MREFLRGLDLDSETIDTIMAEHGKLVTKDKEKIQELKNDLKKAQDDLADANKDVDKKIQDALATEKKNFEVKMELKDQVHNVDIMMSQLDLEKVVMDENGKIKSGLKEQLDAIKKTDAFLFKEPANNNNNGFNQAFIKGATPKNGEGAPQTNLSAGEAFAKSLAQGKNDAVKNSAESIYFGE